MCRTPLALVTLLALVTFGRNADAQMVNVQVCVVERGALIQVAARYNGATGDTLVNGRAFSDVYPSGAGYSAGADWYIDNSPITSFGTTYVKYGLPRVLGVSDIQRYGEFEGVTLFAEAGASGTAEVLYVPVRTGCEFQPYQMEIEESVPTVGEPIRGTLSSGDATAADDSYYDEYSIEGAPGEQIVVEMTSSDFDAFLLVGRMNGDTFEQLDVNDDGDDFGTNARIIYTFPDFGEYIIRANSYMGGATGEYILTIEYDDLSLGTPISTGAPVSGELTASDKVDVRGTYYDDFEYRGREGDRIVITMRAEDVDTYLAIGEMLLMGGDLDVIESNDDGPDMGTDSRIEMVLPSSGTYVIRASTFAADETGAYKLSVQVQ